MQQIDHNTFSARWTRLLLGLLLLLAPAAPAAEIPSEPSEPTEAPITMVPREFDHAHGLSLVPPAGWLDYFSGDDSFMAWCAPAKLTPTSRFAAYFRVSVAKDLNLPVEDIGAHLKPFFNQVMGKWTLAGEGFERIDGRKSYFISVRQDPVSCGCQDLQYYIPGSGQVYYLLTFSAPIDDFARYQRLFRDVAHSVEVL